MKNRRSSRAIGVFIESSSVLGTRLGFEAVLRMVRHLDLRNSVVFLAKILWAFENQRIDQIQLQLEISTLLLKDYLGKIQLLLSDKSSALIFQHQILALIKLIVINSARRNEVLGEIPFEQMKKQQPVGTITVLFPSLSPRRCFGLAARRQ